MQISGLGAISPNMMVCGFPDRWREQPESASSWADLMRAAKVKDLIFCGALY